MFRRSSPGPMAHPAWLQYHGPAHDAREYPRRGGTQLHILPPPPPPPLTDLLLPPPPPPPPPELLHPHFMPTLTLGGSCLDDASSYCTRKSGARPRHLRSGVHQRHSRSASPTRRTKHASKRARTLRSVTASSAPRYSRRPFTIFTAKRSSRATRTRLQALLPRNPPQWQDVLVSVCTTPTWTFSLQMLGSSKT